MSKVNDLHILERPIEKRPRSVVTRTAAIALNVKSMNDYEWSQYARDPRRWRDCAERSLASSTCTRPSDLRLYDGSGRREVQSSAERTLSRLRFDLHDGPQQDVIMLAEDLRMFRDQLADVIGDPLLRDRILGRVDDLEARLVALEGDLRRISASLLSPFSRRESLPDAIAQLAEAFTTRTQIEPELEMGGELTGLSDSQQIALLAVMHETLANIREHSDAEHVTITLFSDREGIRATVTDDGRGFDPDRALVAAARAGHLGLVGMHERLRLLGGQMNIDSRLGGPTVVSVCLPAWPATESRRTHTEPNLAAQELAWTPDFSDLLPVNGATSFRELGRVGNGDAR